MSQPLSPRPFRVLGVQQIAIGGDDKRALSSFWGDTLGIPTTGSYRSERHNVDEDILTLGEGPHAVELDLMEPVDPSRSPRVNSPALNHIGLWVDDLHAAVDWLRGQGVRVLGEISPGAAGHDVCFIHPRGNEAAPVGATGVLLELVQAPAEVIAALGASRE
ncbi:MAG: VOC family protein [Planctomycetes bacterium]|nr:VOC family protein [Planctomycetota bacterium]